MSSQSKTRPEMLYPVHERFFTWQGEGFHMGKPAFFIRLFGCPVKCPWCDSAGTWHRGYVPNNIEKFTANQLAAEATEHLHDFGIVVITGGEPAIHDLLQLTDSLETAGFYPHLETSGSFPIRGDFEWITLSPKKWKKPLKENVEAASEFKFIIEQPADIYYYLRMIQDLSSGYYDWDGIDGGETVPDIWLHPEWSQRDNPQVLSAISEAVKEHRAPFRAGWQLHKLYKVDQADTRSRIPVPLGGDPKKGY